MASTINASTSAGIVTSADTSGVLQLQTGGTTAVTVDASQNVGIGTSSPSANLEVKSASNPNIKASTDNNAYSYLTLNTWALDRAQIRAEAANPGAGSGTGSGTMSFWTAGNPTLTERMRIDGSGNVGIGTSSPAASLSVAKQATALSGTGNSYGLYMYPTSSGLSYIDSITSLTGNTSLSLRTYNNGTYNEVRMDSSGNVGIGTSSIAEKLRVQNTTGVNTTFTNNVDADVKINLTSGVALISPSTGVLALGTASTERMRLDTSGNLQMQSGAVMPYAPAPASISTTATLTNANIQAQIINTTGTTYTVTMPLGTTLETLATWATTNIAYDFYVINTATGTITMAVNTGVTSLGGLTITTGTSAQFRIRRTAANTFVLYRLG